MVAYEQTSVLIVDDEPAICWGFEQVLGAEGFRVMVAGSAEKGLEIARLEQPSLIVLDVRLPGIDGLSALPRFRALAAEAPVIVITAFGDLETAVTAVREGATDYLTKPFRIEDVLRVVQGALQAHQEKLQPPNVEVNADSILVGRSAAMQTLYRQIAMVADSDLSVLITGETGTGKELIAKAIHAHSRRNQHAYLPIAPAALSESLVESELFGHVRGAFTGAAENRKGLFELAEGGTVLLDEIGDLPAVVQVKLLRVLEQREYMPVGDVRPRPCNVRVLAATNADLGRKSEAGEFRQDLYYRLAAVEIKAPPLRERLEDIELLSHYFLSQAGISGESRNLSADALSELHSRPWHGNVRELRNAIAHAAVLSRGQPIRADHLPEPISPESTASPKAAVSDNLLPHDHLRALIAEWTEREIARSDTSPNLYERLLAIAEPPLLDSVLNHCNGNRAAAAEMLGMHRGTLRERMRRHQIGD